MPKRLAQSGSLSVLTLATSALPSYSLANSSTAGAIILQGPHHGAQKSTSTGIGDCKIVFSNASSETCTGIFVAMIDSCHMIVYPYGVPVCFNYRPLSVFCQGAN